MFQALHVWLLALGGAALGGAFVPAAAQTLEVLTHSSFSLSEELVAAFTEETGIEVTFIQGGDAGETVNRAILTRANPLADVLFGVDNSLIARAAQADLFEPYTSPQLARVPERYRFSELVTPVDVGYVNFNYDVAWFEAEGLEPPTSLEALTEPAYRDLTVVQNPASSSPGLAFMLTTIAKFGDGWLAYWAALRDNGLQVTDGWTDAYYTAFTRYGGDRPIVLSYASSPAAEVVFAEEALDAAPTANLFCEGCVFEQIEAAGILAGSDNVEAARTFIDWLLSREVQEDIPLNMFVYPVSEDAEVPEVFREHGGLPEPEHVAEIAFDEVAANLDAWLEAWTRVVQQGQDPGAVR
ncbi:thiamine ABC transporter substrate-binding protein [Truepera radiovictrix]|uniref:ABC transporter, periplasmic binding protein, thiB subfamily n=1 Tax=Truepera radiovictrix (strain DSM 17093 / CIP 108686 / LMG 22925 / RQ-24) TaxID=649638 RepID=D7CUH7_TRURR|nr:thiamine ABC transporter substrate-binding protein [Truepera radiovictrix]ADI15762.1 ABC transporter, periplasmic binding protein, thiB subfamily [Truepera radiovictrix DSM 17093]WMT58611.1 thiamine ABC transporter substrate-binding protein [Truepera radiovictrix]